MKPLKLIIIVIITLIVITLFIRLSSDVYIGPIETNSELVTMALNDSVCQPEIEQEQLNNRINNSTVSEFTDTLHLEIPRLVDTRAEQILTREGYTCSYNQETRNAIWVAWHLTKEHTNGPWKRNGIPYIEDYDVKGCRQENSDWEMIDLNDKGIDHGHLYPAGDNKWDKEAMIESFYLTNICPQNSKLNQGIWETLESKCREWAKKYDDLYIVCGPIFCSKDYKTIGTNRIGIPDAFYKVIYRPNGDEGIGFIFPNSVPTKDRIEEYAYTIDEIEKLTNIDFFYNLQDSIENIIELYLNLNNWEL